MGVWRRILLSACLVAVGCVPRESQHVGAADPLNNIPAMQTAAQNKDRSAIAALVRQLSSDDPAIRFYAIEALHRITGQTFGYHYYDDTADRRPAVRQWEKWVTEQHLK